MRIRGWVTRLGWIGLIPLCLLAEPIKFEIKGEAAILMNAQSGAILFEQDAHALHYPASTTKVATALYALKLKGEELEMPIAAEQDSLATITQGAKRQSNYKLPSYWQEPDGTHIGIRKGEILTLRDLLNGALIASGNDASNVIAQALGPSIPRFMEGLNAYLKELGCQHTTFLNPHGLHDPQHRSTAYELALIAKEALRYPVFCEIVAQKRFMRPKTNKLAATTLLQGNRLIRPGKLHYPKAIGIKTGYHAKAKNTFIGAAKADGRTLIVVLLGYKDRTAIFQDAIQLFETAFNQPKVRRVYLKAGPQTFMQQLPHADRTLQTYLKDSLSLDYYPAEDPKAKCLLYWKPLTLPITKDQEVGELHLISAEGNVLKHVPLLAEEKVELDWPYRWFNRLPSLSWLFIAGLSLSLLGLLIAFWQKAHSKHI